MTLFDVPIGTKLAYRTSAAHWRVITVHRLTQQIAICKPQSGNYQVRVRLDDGTLVGELTRVQMLTPDIEAQIDLATLVYWARYNAPLEIRQLTYTQIQRVKRLVESFKSGGG